MKTVHEVPRRGEPGGHADRERAARGRSPDAQGEPAVEKPERRKGACRRDDPVRLEIEADERVEYQQRETDHEAEQDNFGSHGEALRDHCVSPPERDDSTRP